MGPREGDEGADGASCALGTVHYPGDEVERLEDLRAYGILDTDAEESFDAITRLAAHICHTSMALVTLVDRDRQWFKSRIGIGAAETPREFSFCSEAILTPTEPFIIPDARSDPRFKDNPLVTGPPFIRFYAGVPIVTPHGHALGTLSVLDQEPGTLTDEQLALLNDLSLQVLAGLELRMKVADLAHEVARREAAERALQEASAERENIMETVPDIIYALNLDGNLVRWNRQLEEVTGFAPEALLGRSAESFFPEEERALIRERIQQALEEGYTSVEAHLLLADGSGRLHEFTGRPLLDADGRPLGVTGVGRDVSEIRSAEEELRRQRDDLERLAEELRAANRDLEAFSYSVSHDLRAPLRGIDYLSQVVLEEYGGQIDADCNGCMRRLRAEVARMGEIIDDLLSISRITRGELRLENIDLSAIAEEVVDELRRRDPERDVTVEVQPGIRGRGDARLLRVALENLLGNAWKYTSKTSGARIAVSAEDSMDGKLVVSVEDNGAGFPPSQAHRLFAAFQRIHGKEFEGSGIGLATVQRIIERHGGRVWGRSEGPGQGARFSFTLPLPEEARRPPPAPARGAPSRQYKQP